MMQQLFHWTKTYERHLSALAMAAGFIADNLVFVRVDLWQTQVLLTGYAVTCFIAIPLLHWVEMHPARLVFFPHLRLLLPLATQFALGGFWSAFVIFYGRSAVLGASWPFLIFILLVFIGSEYFHQYHTRLVFTSVLFFFALYSYAIFAVPIYTRTIGTLTFLLSGAVAVGVFALFTIFLRIVAHERFMASVWRIRIGAAVVVILMNLFYFTSILPPLPQAAKAAGIYHNVWRVSGTYLATNETDQSWQVQYLGFQPTVHITPGESLFAYSSVFAPTALATTIVHRWQWYDPVQKIWVTGAIIPYTITGGRDGGYRGYSKVVANVDGEWRVNVETSDGRLIARLPFLVERVVSPPLETTVTLK